MNPRIDLITIVTGDVPRMVAFYRDVLGFVVADDMHNYVEFESAGVRFSICHRDIMYDATGHESFTREASGQRLELAFPVPTPEAVDRLYEELVGRGATPVKGPADMPWGQRTAFFADPDGNIHEIFASLAVVED
ncbi:MAG: glyoxalase [Chloroflexi bacterium]|jgi:lactoylglutathione lyase|nr:glyoxalase [Chloroflexota bacterium]